MSAQFLCAITGEALVLIVAGFVVMLMARDIRKSMKENSND